jgi:putative membrane protein
MRTRSLFAFTLALSLALLTSATARAADAAATEKKEGAAEKSKLASADHKFVMNAATGGELEVTLGKLAAEKGTSDDVKKFGQMMVDDHTKANDELKTLASSKGVDLTKAQDKAQKQGQKMSDTLSKKSGADFDKAYIDDMVKDHEKDVKEFKTASESAKDEDVKAFAGKTLPTLQHHLDQAKEIQSKLKGSASAK